MRMPREHIEDIILCKQPLKTEGKIHYTKPYDMLKAEDRAEVCEFLYWLGCLQNQGRSSLMNTEGKTLKEQVSIAFMQLCIKSYQLANVIF